MLKILHLVPKCFAAFSTWVFDEMSSKLVDCYNQNAPSICRESSALRRGWRHLLTAWLWFKQAVRGGEVKSLHLSREWVLIGVGTSPTLFLTQYLKTLQCTTAELSKHPCLCATCLSEKEIKIRENLWKIGVFRVAKGQNKSAQVRYTMAGSTDKLCSILG